MAWQGWTRKPATGLIQTLEGQSLRFSQIKFSQLPGATTVGIPVHIIAALLTLGEEMPPFPVKGEAHIRRKPLVPLRRANPYFH